MWICWRNSHLWPHPCYLCLYHSPCRGRVRSLGLSSLSCAHFSLVHTSASKGMTLVFTAPVGVPTLGVWKDINNVLFSSPVIHTIRTNLAGTPQWVMRDLGASCCSGIFLHYSGTLLLPPWLYPCRRRRDSKVHRDARVYAHRDIGLHGKRRVQSCVR